MNTDEVTGKIVESKILTSVARVSMALALPTIGFVYYQIQENQTIRFDAIENRLLIASNERLQQQATTMNTAIQSQKDLINANTNAISLIKNQITAESSAAAIATATTNQKLDRMADSISTLASTVAGLSTTVQLIVDSGLVLRTTPRSLRSPEARTRSPTR